MNQNSRISSTLIEYNSFTTHVLTFVTTAIRYFQGRNASAGVQNLNLLPQQVYVPVLREKNSQYIHLIPGVSSRLTFFSLPFSSQVNDLDSNTRSWEETLEASTTANNPDMWIAGSTIPTLGESRGKVVLANGMPREEQNDYLVTWVTIGDKRDSIREFFEDGTPEDNTFRINYLSATGGILPKTVAGGFYSDGGFLTGSVEYAGTNEIALEYSDGCLGIVMFDFIGEDAIAHIVSQQVSRQFEEVLYHRRAPVVQLYNSTTRSGNCESSIPDRCIRTVFAEKYTPDFCH